MFEAVRGANARADIALDDISILQGPCNSPGNVSLTLCLYPSHPEKYLLIKFFETLYDPYFCQALN